MMKMKMKRVGEGVIPRKQHTVSPQKVTDPDSKHPGSPFFVKCLFICVCVCVHVFFMLFLHVIRHMRRMIDYDGARDREHLQKEQKGAVMDGARARVRRPRRRWTPNAMVSDDD